MLLKTSSYAVSHKLHNLLLCTFSLFFCFLLEGHLPSRKERFVEKLLSPNGAISGDTISQLQQLPKNKQNDLTELLLENLLQQENLWRRQRASLMFLKIQPQNKELVLKFIPLLQDPSIQVRGYIAKTLGDMGPIASEALIPLTTSLLEEDDYYVRENMMKALAQIRK